MAIENISARQLELDIRAELAILEKDERGGDVVTEIFNRGIYR